MTGACQSCHAPGRAPYCNADCKAASAGPDGVNVPAPRDPVDPLPSRSNPTHI